MLVERMPNRAGIESLSRTLLPSQHHCHLSRFSGELIHPRIPFHQVAEVGIIATADVFIDVFLESLPASVGLGLDAKALPEVVVPSLEFLRWLGRIEDDPTKMRLSLRPEVEPDVADAAQ